MSTAQTLAFAGAKFIKKKAWKTGRVYIDNYDVREARTTWCFIHPTDEPSLKPVPVFLYMLEGDDWEEVPDARDEPCAIQLHAGDSPRDEAEEG